MRNGTHSTFSAFQKGLVMHLCGNVHTLLGHGELDRSRFAQKGVIDFYGIFQLQAISVDVSVALQEAAQAAVTTAAAGKAAALEAQAKLELDATELRERLAQHERTQACLLTSCSSCIQGTLG